MRWLLAEPGPHFSVYDVYEGWAEALRGLGEQVFTFNLGDRISFYDATLIHTEEEGRFRKALPRAGAVELAAEGLVNAAMKCWPHVILMVSAFFYPAWMLDLFRSRGIRVVLLHTECPYQDEEQLCRAAHADVSLVNDPVSLARYEAIGPAAYMPHAYRPSVHYPGGLPKDWDFSFVGTGFPSRAEFFRQMDLSGLKVKLAGPWEDPETWADFDHDDCIDNEQTAAIYRASKTGLNLYRREGEDTWDGEGVACGPREIEMAACGLWFTRDPRPESDETFPMLPSFAGPGEAAELIRWHAAHDSAREKATAAAREAIAGRTFESNARALMQMLAGERLCNRARP